MQKKTRKKLLVFLFILTFTLQLFGCTDNENDTQKNDDTQTEETVSLVYGRSENIVLDTSLDFQALGVEYFDDAIELYQDKKLQDKVYCKYNWDKENHTLSLLPPANPLLNISTSFSSKSLQTKYDHSEYYFFDKGKGNDWGNLDTMYLAKWIDWQTGEKRKEPEISEIHFKGELDTPQNFQFTLSETGNATFSWNEVAGADCYLIVKAVYRTDDLHGFFESCHIVADTTDTLWQAEADDNCMNGEFREKFTQLYENSQNYYGVIAIGKNGTSMISSVLSEEEITKRLPYRELANGTVGESSLVRYAETIELLSRYQWIELCDKTTGQRLIDYQTNKAEITPVTLVGQEPADMLKIPYTVDGTAFDGCFYVKNFNPETYQKDLELLQKRQNILKNKMAGMLSEVKITVRPSASEKNKNKPSVSDNTADTSVIATTDLSHFLAVSMLQGEETIPLFDLPETMDTDGFMDAFYEAYFQNPLIPSIKEISVSESLNEMSVIYEEDKDTRKEKQQKVMEQIDFIASELLEENMSDTDKVLAINSYLCDNISYDETAAGLSSADTFSDSATVYGALVNHKGICTAYAGCFQLLAKATGLESIIVTGTNGSQNHAWNKVKIDGKWYVVDVTSNDGTEIPNILLNVSDETAGLLLKEDKRYLCDENIENYTATSDKKEYYRLADKYYKKDEIAEALVKELSYNKKAILRTAPSLGNEDFQSIVRQVMDSLKQQKIQGYYELGVIYLEEV